MQLAPCVLFRLSAFYVLLSTGVRADFFFPSTSVDPQAGLKATVALRERQRQEFLAWANGTVPSNFSVISDPLHLLRPQLAPLFNTTASSAYWRNITGIFSGTWKPAVDLGAQDRRGNETTVARGSFPWNSGGRTTFDLNEEYELPTNVSVVRGSITLASNGSKNSVPSLEFDVDGLHYLHTGRMLLVALFHESPQLTDPRDVLSMISPDDTEVRSLAIQALNSTFATRIRRVAAQIAAGKQDSVGGSDAIGGVAEPVHNCTLHIYGQLRPVGSADLTPAMDILEHELANPEGLNHIRPPPLVLDSVFYSPDCAQLLIAPEAVGQTNNQFWNKVVHYALSLFAVQLGLAWLLARQMDATRTPSRLAKVSHYSFMMQWAIDFFLAVTHLSVGIVSNNISSIPLISASFVSVILCIAFTHRYVHSIMRVQGPEHQPVADATPAPVTNPASATAQSADASAAESVSPASEPVNPTAPEGSNVPEPSTLRERIDALTRHRFFNLAVFGFVFYFVIFQPVFTLIMMMPLMYSFWIPQIVRNSRRGTRHAVQTRYVLGATAGRLFVPLYLLACPASVVRPFIEATAWVYFLAAYLVLQAVILLLQDLLGPLFFLPATYRTTEGTWEWHPPRASLGVYTPGRSGKERIAALHRAEEGGEPDETEDGEDAPMLTSGVEDGNAAPYSYGTCAICLSSIDPLDEVAQDRAQAHRLAEHAGDAESRRREDRRGENDETLFEYDEEAELDAGSGPSRPYPPEKVERSKARELRTASSSGVRDRYVRSGSNAVIRTSAAVVSRLVPVLTRVQLSLVPIWERLRPVRNAHLSDRAVEIMVAPCGHIFHTPCLKQWLNIKTECPTCRRPLPPI